MFWPMFVSAVTFWGAALAGAWVLGRRYVRAVEARAALATDITALRERVALLEGQVARSAAPPGSLTAGGASDALPSGAAAALPSGATASLPSGATAALSSGATDAMPSSATDQLAGAVHAIRCGDHAALARLLAADPALARRRVWTGREARTLLHVATDSPGHLPGVATTLRLLVHAGADVNAPFEGPHAERPLHWAASNDDVEALDALLDLGADIEAPGSVLGGGPPLVDAVGFGQWNAARRLVARGARVTLDQSAALGLVDRLTERLAALGAAPAADALSRALWFACHGCQQDAADLLVARGADVNWLPPWERLTPLDAAVRSGATTLAESLRQHGARSAHATNPGSST